MKDLEKLTKDKLIQIIEEQYEKIKRCANLETQLEELRNELELYDYLKQHYVPTMEDNKRLNDSIVSFRQRVGDLEDLCNRQQKIIDSRCN
jgi:cell shape-determining protein MreC